MPSREDITFQITRGDRADTVRREYLDKLSKYTGRNTIVYGMAYTSKKVLVQNIPDILLSVSQDDVQGFMSAIHHLQGSDLDLIIHSPGGSPEATEQIVNYLRAKFTNIRAIIPQNAMSAATMLSCACDEIIMAKHSAIGPIDPQMNVPSGNGRYLIAAQSILDEFDQAKQEISQNPTLVTLWLNRINSYPHGFFKKCEDTIALSKTMVESWLSQYMFNREATNKPAEIAEWLGNASEHLTHEKPISIDTAIQRGLKVQRLEDDPDLQDLVLSVFHATMITFDTTGCVKLIENQNGKGWYSNINVQPPI